MKITVAGAGYVGMSMAVLLSQRHSVKVIDVVPHKIDLINSRQSPIQDDYIEDYFLGKIPEKVKRECVKEKPDIKFD